MLEGVTEQLQPLDWFLIVVYFAVVMGIGFYFARRAKDSVGYFLGGRHAGFIAVGAALFAANISSEHFVGLAGSGYKSGLAVAQFELFAAVCCMMLGWIFVPFYIRAGIFTMPEFLERRYNKQCRTYLTVISLISYVLTKISVTLFTGAIFLKFLFGWDLYTSSLIMVIATGIYTVAGGLAAVIYTELVQAFILIGGAIILTIVGLNHPDVGGLSGLISDIPKEHWSMLKPIDHPDYPWLGMIFGLPILGVWYWCTDQYIVQRALGAKSIDHARGGALFAGFLKLLPMFLLVVPGMIALKLFPDIIVDGRIINGEAVDNSNQVYPMLTTLLPAGVKGLVIAGLMAAMMSSLAACFNSCGTLFAMDFYKPRKPGASERELVLVGRIATVIMTIIGILYVPVMKHLEGNQIYKYLQEIQAYISPPIAAVFLLGVFWKRLNGQGAIVALWTGFVLGIGKLVFKYLDSATEIDFGSLAPLIEMNFLHYAIVMFAICVGVLVVVSLLSPPKNDKELEGLTFATTSQESKAVDIAESSMTGRTSTIVATFFLIAALLALWLIFYVIIPLL